MPDKGLLPYRVKASRLPSGTRRAFLVDEDGIPEPYSTLYVTMHFRNGNRSLATQEAALNSINALFAYARKYSIDLVSRFKRGEYLGRLECEALRRTVQRNFSAQAQEVSSVQRGKKGHIYISATVASSTQYSRVTYIGRFLEWLAIDLYLGSEVTKLDEIDAMVQRIFSLRTGRARRSAGAKREFSEADDAFLMQSIEIDGPMNPFAKSTQLRNALLICMMRLLGKRRGEVLNIQLRDIRLREQEIDIVRRADTVEDPRRLQPLVKTRQHTIPFGESLLSLISAYLKQRREVPGATKQPYLFVTHKAGPSQGQPMTIDALKEVFKKLRQSDARLSHLHPHLLRHFHSDQLAKIQQEGFGGQDAEAHRRQRNYLSGRSPSSDLDFIYTERELSRQSRSVSLRLQQELDATAPALNIGKLK